VIPKRSVTEEPKKETICHLLLRQELDAAQGLLLTAAFYWDLNDQTRGVL
jgi:hypothetical protein